MQLRLLMHAVNNRFTMISLLYYTFPIISLHQNYNYVYNYNFLYFPLEMSLQKNATVTQLNSQCQYRHHSSSHAEYINHLYIRFAKLPNYIMHYHHSYFSVIAFLPVSLFLFIQFYH